MHLQLGLAADALVQTAQQCTTASQEDTSLVDICGQLGRRGSQRVEDGLFYTGYTLVQRMGNFLVVHTDFFGQTRQQVATRGLVVLGRVGQLADGSTHMNLHLLCRTHTDNHVVLTLHIVHHIVVEDIAGDADRVVAHDTAERNDGDLGRATSDVNHHMTLRLQHVDADTDGCGHRLVYHADFLGAGLLGTFAHGTLFDIGDTTGDTDDHTQRRRQERTIDTRHADEFADEVLGHLEVGNHATTQRTNGLHVAVGLAIHQLGPLAYSDYLVVVAVISHDRGLVDDHLVVIYDDGIGGTQVHSHLSVEE